MIYDIIPLQVAFSPYAKQQYISGHICYVGKFPLLTNGTGIIRHITFLNVDLKQVHTKISVKKSVSSDGDKSLGDSAFDSIYTYGFPIISGTKASLIKLVTIFIAIPLVHKITLSII